MDLIQCFVQAKQPNYENVDITIAMTLWYKTSKHGVIKVFIVFQGRLFSLAFNCIGIIAIPSAC